MTYETSTRAQFHIPADWPVLVLEDTDERICWFRQRLPHAVFAKTASEAIGLLSQTRFKVVFLDHDLHWMHAADNSIHDGTGKQVAQFLRESGFGGIVVIHSKNEDGVAIMKKYLPNATLARYGEFEISTLPTPWQGHPQE